MGARSRGLARVAAFFAEDDSDEEQAAADEYRN